MHSVLNDDSTFILFKAPQASGKTSTVTCFVDSTDLVDASLKPLHYNNNLKKDKNKTVWSAVTGVLL